AVYETCAPVGPVASAVMFAGRFRTGKTCTVTSKWPTTVFDRRSVAVHVTLVVMPAVNVDRDAGSHSTGTTPSIASTAEAVHVTTVELVVMSAGSVRTGGAVSITTIGKDADVEPKLSVAVQVTMVVSSG